MKISPELRQKILLYVSQTMDVEGAMHGIAGEIVDSLTYKKRGRKIGWRKYRVLKPE